MKVVITGRNFSGKSNEGLHMLKAAGLEIADYSDRDLGTGTTEEEIIALAKDADIAIIGLEPYSKNVIENCPKLKLISRRGIGYDNVDLAACKKQGITVLRTVGKVEGAVAEHVIAYILYMARRVDLQSAYMHQAQWKRIMMPGAKNRVLGLVGFGGIGKEIAKRANALGMKVVYTCRHPEPKWEAEYQVKYLPLEELLQVSDYVSVNVPLTEETRGMFHQDRIAGMKKGSVLINIARGPVVVELAVKAALESGHLAGACIDVFDSEPCTDSKLIGVPNVILTPHTAPFTSENFEEMNLCAAANVVDFLQNCVDEKMIIN